MPDTQLTLGDPRVAEAMEWLRRIVNFDDSWCRYDHHGDCQEHGWDLDEDTELCGLTRIRQLLLDLGYPIEQPTPASPFADGTLPEIARIPAVCIELALTPVERHAVTYRILIGGLDRSPTMPVCAVLALGWRYKDALSWVEPVREQIDPVGWGTLGPKVSPGTWRSLVTLTAAYLRGRQPTADEVDVLGTRALIAYDTVFGNDESVRLLAAYDNHAGLTLPHGMHTDEPGEFA